MIVVQFGHIFISFLYVVFGEIANIYITNKF